MRKLIFNWRLERQIKKANRLRQLTKYRYLVILWKGKPRAIPKRILKNWINRKKLNTTIAQIQKNALYITT